MAMIACGGCGRQIAERSIRCLYCGYRVAPVDGPDDAAAEARLVRLRAMYSAGLGLPGTGRRGWTERLRDESLATRILVAGLLTPLMVVVPFKTFRWIRDIFRP